MRWQRIKYQPGTGIGPDNERITACREHRELSKNAAKEGMVLLKNKGGILPFAKGTKLALFGKGSIDYVKGGGGSGDVTVEYITSLYAGLKELKDNVTIFDELSDFYIKNVRDQYESGAVPGMTAEPSLDPELCARARAFTDTAIITISRFSGEGWDRRSSYDKNSKTDGQDPLTDTADRIFEKGDFYLSEAEEAMVNTVRQLFDKIVVVLNVGGVVSAAWFAEDDAIAAALMAWQGGMEGGRAAAELLCGIGNPGGKLADTFAEKLEDYPSSETFHESDEYVNYTDDIYVGYRYFETIPGAGRKVIYPFGYGLSYTEFVLKTEEVIKDSNNICLRITAVNTGSRPGREVVQVYVKAPQGVLGKPELVLVGFEKTRELKPGESQLMSISCDLKDIASYDDLGKIRKSAYILEAGEYTLYYGNSVRSVEPALTWVQDKDIITEQLSARLVPSQLEKRMLSDGSFETLPAGVIHDPDEGNIAAVSKTVYDGMTPDVRPVKGHKLWGEDENKKKYSFLQVDRGEVSLKDFISQMSNEELAHMLGGQPNTGVANTFGFGNLPEYDIPDFMTADGPAGLRINKECGVNTTAWPCATLLACTWDPEIVFSAGEAGAKEVKENNIAVWLTPAINIHRSPMCGRNFEYYSEDPLLTGKMAAAMVRGIQSQHIGASVKHFAFNNKETNRKNSDSRVSERAAREIYLKGFEHVVKEADPWCIMSSYNIINGWRTSECRELITDILRGEWGFKGFVTTDWWNFAEHYKEVKAGNDVKMPCGYPKNLLEALDKGLLTREEMECCAERLLRILMKID